MADLDRVRLRLRLRLRVGVGVRATARAGARVRGARGPTVYGTWSVASRSCQWPLMSAWLHMCHPNWPSPEAPPSPPSVAWPLIAEPPSST